MISIFQIMKKSILAIMAIFLMMASSVSALEINPAILNIEGNSGDFIIQSVELYNDRDTKTTINISVVGISNYFLYKSTYTLNPYERKTITIGFTVSGSESGLITYEYGDMSVSQTVYINAKKTVIIFPPNPKAGSTISIVSPSKMSASGFISCSETGGMYAVNLMEGTPFTFVNLSNKDYGSAMLLLVWGDGEITYNFFNISKSKATTSQEKELSIDFGEGKIKYGDTRIITLKYGEDNVEGSFIIVKPDGNQILKDTNKYGQISINFDTKGTWTFIANYNDITKSETLVVGANKINIDVDKEVNVGDEITIELSEDKGSFEITTPSEDIISGNVRNGEINFIPEEGGEYLIHVESDGASSNETFTAFYNPKIVLKDSNGNFVYDGLKVGKQYNVEIRDINTGKLIDENLLVEITGMMYGNIMINHGMGTWIPQQTGKYTLRIQKDKRNYLMEYTCNYDVYKSGSGGSYTSFLIGAIIIIVLILLYRYRDKIPFEKLKWKKGSNVIYKG